MGIKMNIGSVTRNSGRFFRNVVTLADLSVRYVFLGPICAAARTQTLPLNRINRPVSWLNPQVNVDMMQFMNNRQMHRVLDVQSSKTVADILTLMFPPKAAFFLATTGDDGRIMRILEDTVPLPAAEIIDAMFAIRPPLLVSFLLSRMDCRAKAEQILAQVKPATLKGLMPFLSYETVALALSGICPQDAAARLEKLGPYDAARVLKCREFIRPDQVLCFMLNDTVTAIRQHQAFMSVAG